MKDIKELLLSGFMSLSKAEQEVFKNMLGEQQNDVAHEQQIRKQEIKILSKKRFYEIMDRADEYFTEKGKETLSLLMEQRGFKDGEISFKNGTSNGEYTFQTDNGMYRFANLVRIKNNHGMKELSFYINVFEHPSVPSNYEKLTNLTQFQVYHNRKQYLYEISNFVAKEKINDYEIALKFSGKVLVDGVKPVYEDEDERVMTVKDLIEKPNTYTLGSRDFL